MRTGEYGELVLEGETEARVAAHFLLKNNAQIGLLFIEPPVEELHIGRLNFLFRRIEDRIGTGDSTEHVVRDPVEALMTAKLISVASVPNNIFSIIPRNLTRRGFLGKRVREYWQSPNAPKWPKE